MNVRVILLSGQHLVRAMVSPDGRRLLDVLNDKTADYLKLADNILSWARDPEQALGQFPRGAVLKINLGAVLPFEDEHEAPQRRQNMMVRKNRYEVALTLPEYEVRGFVHLVTPQGPLEYQAQLVREGATFFPITGARFMQHGSQAAPLTAPVALINRHRLGLFHISEAPSPAPPT